MMRRIVHTATRAASVGLVALLAACGVSGHAHTIDEEIVQQSVYVGTTTAYTSVEGDEEVHDLQFAVPATMAVCAENDRVGVSPLRSSIDNEEVEAFLNTSDDPVVFVPSSEVIPLEGSLDLALCSIADDPEDMKGRVLHGWHAHSGGQ